MHAYTSSRISLPSRSAQPNLPEAFEPALLQPLSFYPAGAEIYAQGGKASLSAVGGVGCCVLLANRDCVPVDRRTFQINGKTWFSGLDVMGDVSLPAGGSSSAVGPPIRPDCLRKLAP
ncbi:hypothetical protein AB0V79_20120 [Mesorhizobium ciceri]|uniref:hypothetical protein n=1 Tax=Mesorhizobium ciceri TaxID=39645 RepID=UPI000AA724BE|nr:hypothetical protein [Mesorhizobium ciceri]